MGRLAGHRIDPFLLAGGKAEEIGHGFRGFVVEQVDFDVTFGGVRMMMVVMVPSVSWA